jgi:leader peptidase (prepilin peptidase) / N-methyltransferase
LCHLFSYFPLITHPLLPSLNLREGKLYTCAMWVIYAIFGAVFGSAANALIDRLPKNISWTRGRSVCDSCKHELKVRDLVPLISFVTLGGKCRYCHKKIPTRNFWVEMVMAVGFATISYLGNLGYLSEILLMGILWATTIIAVMDLETKLVADVMVIIWGGLILIFQFSIFNFQSIFNYQFLINHLVGMLVGVGLIGGLWLFSKGKAMGSGDIGIAAVMGWWLGWPKIWVGLWVAFVTGAIYGSYLLITKRKKLKSEVAFGPWLVIGSWVGWIWGERLIKLIFKF